jgi:ADP-ribose pyrophosphatase
MVLRLKKYVSRRGLSEGNRLCTKFENVRVLRSEVIYEKHGRRVVVDTLEFADGSRHEWVYFGGVKVKDKSTAVAVAAFTRDDKMLLVKQYRHPLGKLIYDLPAGGIRREEDPQQAVLRELEEETGYTAENMVWIGRFNWAPSNMAGTVELFFTKDLKFKGKFHSDEVANIEFMDFNMVLENVLKGEFIDSTLIIATLMVKAKKLL